MGEKEQAKKIAGWALGGAVGFIGIGLYMAWMPLAFIWFGGWLLAFAIVAQQMGEKKDE